MKTVKYKKYSKYKDSCVEWFTEIPEGWDVVKTKYIAKTIAGGTPSTSVAEYWDGGDIPWLPSGKVQNCNIEEADIFITKLGLRESATKRINRNSVLVALTGATCANAGYLTFCATANQSVVALHEYKNKADSRFLFYSLLSQREQILVFKSGGAQGGVSDKTIKNLFWALPVDTKEQHSIADFLDKKTVKIDALIGQESKLMEILKEKRQAVITHAVTKGLDPKVKMKESGVKWIGKIPGNWTAKALKYCAQVVLGKMICTTSKEGMKLRPYLKSRNIEWESVNLSDVDEMYFNDHELKSYRLTTNNVLVSEGGEVGKTCIWHDELEECYIQNSVHKITCSSALLPRYLLYVFVSYGNQKVFQSIVNQVSIAHLTREKLIRIDIPFPSCSEQQNIIDYLDVQTSKIDDLMKEISEQIDLLNEYKQSLITTAVTGKIDVRSA